MNSMVKPVCSALAFILICCSPAYPQEQTPFSDKKIAELIYQQLSYRYKVEDYILKFDKKDQLARFNLAKGRQLSYDYSGHLIEQRTSEGIRIYYDHGFPVKKVDQQGNILSETQLHWGRNNRLNWSLTEQGSRKTYRYYSDNKLASETDHRNNQLYFRQGFSYFSDKKRISYFETRSSDGRTNWVLVDAHTGVIIEEWRVGKGMKRNWGDQYHLFRTLLAEDMQKRYADRLRLRRDSFNQTKGDLIISRLNKGAIYTLKQFIEDIKEERLVFDRQWKHIDCYDVKVILPKVSLVTLDKKVVEKIRVRNRKVYQWNDVRKTWEPYPYDPEVEKIIPLGRGGQAVIEPRYERTQWQFVTNEDEEYVLNTRLVISKEMQEKIAQRWVELDYVKADVNDLSAYIVETRTNYEQARQVALEAMSEKNLGEKVKHLNSAMVRELQTVLSAQVKRRLKERQELRSRDERQLTQAEYMMQYLIPREVLPLSYIKAQKQKLFIKDMGAFNVVTFKELVVRLPDVGKRNSYKYYDDVKTDRGMLKVWEDDPEHPEKGYWRHYVMRSDRDELFEENGQQRLKVDQGSFKWEWRGQWTTDVITGRLYLTKNNRIDRSTSDTDSGESLVEETRRLSDKVKEAGMTESNISWGEKLRRLILGINEVNEQKVMDDGTVLDITQYKNWIGKVIKVKKKLTKNNYLWQIELYDQFNRITEFSNHLGYDLSFNYERTKDDRSVLVEKRNNEKQMSFQYKDHLLTKVKLNSGEVKQYFFNREKPKVVFFSPDDKKLLELIYKKNDKIEQILVGTGNVITYQYSDNSFTIKVKNSQDKEAKLKFNNNGVLLSKEGEKQLINLIFVNYDILKPKELIKIYNRFVSN